MWDPAKKRFSLACWDLGVLEKGDHDALSGRLPSQEQGLPSVTALKPVAFIEAINQDRSRNAFAENSFHYMGVQADSSGSSVNFLLPYQVVRNPLMADAPKYAPDPSCGASSLWPT